MKNKLPTVTIEKRRCKEIIIRENKVKIGNKFSLSIYFKVIWYAITMQPVCANYRLFQFGIADGNKEDMLIAFCDLGCPEPEGAKDIFEDKNT